MAGWTLNRYGVPDDAAERKDTAPHDDPVVAAIASLRSGDLSRMRHVLRAPPADPLVVGALIPLLANRELLGQVVKGLTASGARAAGQLVDALLDPATPDVVRRRLPLVLKSCASSLARDGLVLALGASSFEVRLRCGRALLALTAKHPELALSPPQSSLLSNASSRPRRRRRRPRARFQLMALVMERERCTSRRGVRLRRQLPACTRSSISNGPSQGSRGAVPRLSAAPAPVLEKRGARSCGRNCGSCRHDRVSRKQVLETLSAPDLDPEVRT